jgi:hypothetical protein
LTLRGVGSTNRASHKRCRFASIARFSEMRRSCCDKWGGLKTGQITNQTPHPSINRSPHAELDHVIAL